MSSIRPLPDDVVAQIKSSITITTLNGVVVELLKNSLDASSSKINIDVDYGRGSCIVEDNGFGIPPADFQIDGGLGKLHHTSKDDSSSTTYGTRGSFLASLAALSVLSITSHHHLHHSQNTIIMSKSKVISRQIPAPPHKHVLGSSHGTRVVIRDLFGNMPVRVLQRAKISIEKRGGGRDWDDLRKEITSLHLAWPYYLDVTIRNVVSSQKFQLRGSQGPGSLRIPRTDSELSLHVGSVLSQAALIQPQQKHSWVFIGASTSKLSIKGAISLEPAPTKNNQFISLGIHPLDHCGGHNVFFEDINRIFYNSSFGIKVGPLELDKHERQRRSKDGRYKGDGFTNQELKGPSKGIDRWPMFYIRIEFVDELFPHSRSETLLEEDKGILGSVSELLQLTLVEFLEDHHLFPKRDRLCTSKKLGKEAADSIPMKGEIKSNSGLSWTTGSQKASGLGGSEKTLTTLKPYPNPSTVLRTGSPFNSWSRIKSGRSMQTPKCARNPAYVETLATSHAGSASDCQVAVESDNYSDSESGTPSEEFDSRSRPSKKGSRDPTKVPPIISMIAKSGEVTSKPFKESLPTRNMNISVIETCHPVSRAISQDLKPGMVSWTNPVSRESYYIDTMTGFARNSTTLSAQKAPSPSSSIIYDRMNCPERRFNPSQEPSAWVKEVLEGWVNPVFKATEEPIPQVSLNSEGLESQRILHGHRHNCSQLDIDRAFKDSSARFTRQISKNALRHAKVVSQLDKKFILIKVASLSVFDTGTSHREMLVIVDQHAADERCRIEELLMGLWTTSEVTKIWEEKTKSGVLFTTLSKPMVFDMSLGEIELLRKHSQHFADWGIMYTLQPQTRQREGLMAQTITVTALPSGIIERCKLEPRLVIELIRSEVWKYDEGPKRTLPSDVKSIHAEDAEDAEHESENHQWLRRLHECPEGILDMLNSRACRSAIMFNDELSPMQCKILISRLADCAFPFQCAHGRPSMVPLVDLGTMQYESAFKPTSQRDTFGALFKSWKNKLPTKT